MFHVLRVIITKRRFASIGAQSVPNGIRTYPLSEHFIPTSIYTLSIKNFSTSNTSFSLTPLKAEPIADQYATPQLLIHSYFAPLTYFLGFSNYFLNCS